MKDQLLVGELLLKLDHILQPVNIGHSVSSLGRKGVSNQLIVPEIHVQRQLVVGTFHVKGGHIAYDALHWTVYVEPGKQQIRKCLKRIAWLLIFVVFGNTLDPGNLTALVSIWIR